ncbi:MAG: hypothetical protein JWN45_595 [Acidobacteriaceae bacterium]|nr:hypothetical protein [Acidobacteriaceae bacterium]
MSIAELDHARQLLSGLIGKGIVGVDSYEYQLRLIFGDKSEFSTQSAWRLIFRNNLLIGSGDPKNLVSGEFLKHLSGLKVVSILISDLWDTQLLFENGYFLEVFSDSLRYETWEAHLQVGWVIFSEGSITVFPPAGAPF